MNTATHHSLTGSNLATTCDTAGGTHDITYQLPTTPGGDVDPRLDFSFDPSPTTCTTGWEESMTALSDDWFDAATGNFYPSPSETTSSEPTDIDDNWVPQDVYKIGFQDENGDWRCSYAGCRSLAVFERACDLRKHHSTHTKTLFCPRPECASSMIGFAYPKDYRRHLRSHKPSIPCPYALCGRLFSRTDNMRSHFSKIHVRKRNTLFSRPCRNRSKGRVHMQSSESYPQASSQTFDPEQTAGGDLLSQSLELASPSLDDNL
ncbi:C2H2 type zinc finger domain protein [Colletotrichum scovillei]|nr:C2H2 type zinc finger domain protein [Colletotrichum scovillei]KAF4785321.1 C2H2 type zinc finger domain protein [Colletotrichum scovillei]